MLSRFYIIFFQYLLRYYEACCIKRYRRKAIATINLFVRVLINVLLKLMREKTNKRKDLCNKRRK